MAMAEHILKTDSEVFEAVYNGTKTYEIRFNDRNYQVGDTLILQETQYTGAEMRQCKPLVYTGREYEAVVSHVLQGPLYGLAEGWAILSLECASLAAAQERNRELEEKVCQGTFCSALTFEKQRAEAAEKQLAEAREVIRQVQNVCLDPKNCDLVYNICAAALAGKGAQTE